MSATAIRTEGLTKRYGGVAALDHLNLEVTPGEVVGYLGPNGAGKTTTLRLLLGLISPSEGRGEIFGLDCQRQPMETHRHLGFVGGEANLWPSLTGAETLHLLGRVQGQVDQAYRDELISRFDLDPTKKVRAYSKGNRQKVILIGALMVRPDLLLLDEPTSGLDPLMEQAFRHCVAEARDRGQTVFLSSHILSEVEALCDRVGILRNGKLIEMGTLAQMRHLSALTVEATFQGGVPDVSDVSGVTMVVVNGPDLHCQVRGSIEPLLKVLAAARVTRLVSREPSLEELSSLSTGTRLTGPTTLSERTVLGSPPPCLDRTSRTVIAALCARKAVRSGVIWGYIFGVSVAASAISYTTIYKTATERNALAVAYGSNKATSALFGPAQDLQTVAGFTVFKISMTLMILGAVWGLLTSTRLLRGEEDSGRFDLLLAGQTTRKGATVQVLGGLGAGVFVLWALTAVITVLVGRDSKVDIAPGPALYFALTVVAAAVMFLAVGALTSQLGANRRQAASHAAVFLGFAYALRMIADAGVGLHALIWVSPLGWIEELRPLTSPEPLALVPIAVFTGLLAIIAVRISGSRDVGASIIPDRPTGESHLRFLSEPVGLAFRMMRPAVIGWWVAISLSGLLYGLIAKSAGATISGSSVRRVFSKLGAPGTGAYAVLGVCFLILAILVAFVGAGQITAARSEEASGRLEHLLVRSVIRTTWLGERLVLAIVLLLGSGVAAGCFAWLGAASQNAGVGFVPLLEAGVNLVPPAVTIVGIGVLVMGIRPRMTSIVVYALIGWSLLVVVVGGVGAVSHWILDTSVFHQMASAPAVSPHWEANGIMVALGAVAAGLGAVAFRRRDLQGE